MIEIKKVILGKWIPEKKERKRSMSNTYKY